MHYTSAPGGQAVCPCCGHLPESVVAEALHSLRRMIENHFDRGPGRPKHLVVSCATRMKSQGKRWREIYQVCLPNISYYRLVLALDDKQARLRQRQDQVNLRNAVRQQARRSKVSD
jgi:hypothetical protein